MEKIKVRIEGTRPLLMHSPNSLGKKSGRGERIPEPEDEAERALYKDEKGHVVVPALNILATMKASSKEYKVPGKGKKTFMNYIFAGLQVNPTNIPLRGVNGEDPEWEIDIRPVVVQKARIMRARPKFNEWALEFEVEILDAIIRPENIREFLESAGKYTGIGDFRPLFGLFEVTKYEKMELKEKISESS